MMKITALIVLLVAVGGSRAQDYCALCTDHTMCIYPAVGPKCAPLLTSGTSAADVTAIVDAHNALRARVAAGQETAGSNGAQPPAANMRKMTWDAELATVAQRWANQCNFGHDACRRVSRFGVGQNVYMAGSSASAGSADWRAATQAWYDEVKDFNRNNIAPFQFTTSTGHYTQVAWAESRTVGCGFAKFPQDGWYWSYYVCNYGPAGNVISGTMYEAGTACSRCPGGTTCQGGLCA